MIYLGAAIALKVSRPVRKNVVQRLGIKTRRFHSTNKDGPALNRTQIAGLLQRIF